MSVQQQIDSLKGQQKYLEQSAELSKITVYFSTDEMELPYTPTETFKPSLVFKSAVRALYKTLGNIGERIIWASVYAVIWLPLIIAAYFVVRYMKKRSS